MQVLTITAPIFILISIGYLSVKNKLINPQSLSGMGRFVLTLALPALIFSTLAKLEFNQIVEPSYLLVYGLASVTILALGCGFSYFIRKQSLVKSGVLAMGMTLSNSAFIGFPVLLQVFGNPPAQAFAMSLMIENILILPLVLAVIELGISSNQSTSLWLKLRDVFLRLVTNPLLIAIALGLIFSLFNFSLPVTLSKTLDMLASAAVAVALFTIGGSLVGNPITGNKADIISVMLGKLLVHPLLVLIFLYLLAPNLDTELKLAMIVFSAMPMFSIFPILSSNYGLGKLSASILLVTTAFSFITLTGILLFLTELML